MNARSKSKKTYASTPKQGKQGTVSAKSAKRASLRIIGGQWRSRQLPIPDIEGLRPTPDRVRETVFNWIAPYLAGAYCADLFCGSGALGLEALSREAAHCTFVDASRTVTQQVQKNLATLNCSHADVLNQSAVDFLESQANRENNTAKFDIVFIDPPFRKSWVDKILPLLTKGWLAHNALVYIEMEKEAPAPDLDQQWQLLKEKNAGQLIYRLYQVEKID